MISLDNVTGGPDQSQHGGKPPSGRADPFDSNRADNALCHDGSHYGGSKHRGRAAQLVASITSESLAAAGVKPPAMALQQALAAQRLEPPPLLTASLVMNQ